MDPNPSKCGWSLPNAENLPPPLPPRLPRNPPSNNYSVTVNNIPTQSPNGVGATDSPINFGPTSQLLICPYCHNSISTKVENFPNMQTHYCALCLFFFLCWPFCLCPYYMEGCQVQNHYCTSCNAFLGQCDI